MFGCLAAFWEFVWILSLFASERWIGFKFNYTCEWEKTKTKKNVSIKCGNTNTDYCINEKAKKDWKKCCCCFDAQKEIDLLKKNITKLNSSSYYYHYIYISVKVDPKRAANKCKKKPHNIQTHFLFHFFIFIFFFLNFFCQFLECSWRHHNVVVVVVDDDDLSI